MSTPPIGSESGTYARDDRHLFRRSVKVATLSVTLVGLLAIELCLAWAISAEAGRALREGDVAGEQAIAGVVAITRNFGFAYAVISSCLLGSAVLVVVKLLERSRHRLVRFERLATAGTLAATIAHEVKNPMGIVLSTTQLLSRSVALCDSDRRLLADIEEEVRRADDQLNAFLDLVRDMPMKRESCDLREIARSTLSMLHAQARNAHVHLELRAQDEAITVIADRRRLRQALINIVLNAIEAVGAKGGGGKVRIELSSPLPDAAMITVIDDGPGMTPEVQAAAFEAFVSTKPNGTGLGLSTALRIVERHGGRIEILSEPGHGTTMTMYLPRQERGTSGIFHLRSSRSMAGADVAIRDAASRSQ